MDTFARKLGWCLLGAAAVFSTTVFGGEKVIEYRCGVTGTDRPTTPDGDVPIVKVLNLGKTEHLQLPGGADPKRHFVSCARSQLVPSINDIKVLEAGFKLYIGAPGKPPTDPRMATLFGSKPNIVFVVISGEATPAETRLTDLVMKAMNGK